PADVPIAPADAQQSGIVEILAAADRINPFATAYRRGVLTANHITRLPKVFWRIDAQIDHPAANAIRGGHQNPRLIDQRRGGIDRWPTTPEFELAQHLTRLRGNQHRAQT